MASDSHENEPQQFQVKTVPRRPIEERPKIVLENTDMSVVNIGKELARRWGAIGDDARQRYEDDYMKRLEQYDTEMNEYEKYLNEKRYGKYISRGEGST